MARGVPIETDLGSVNGNTHERVIDIDDEAFLDDDVSINHARNAVRTDVRANARRERQIHFVEPLPPTHGKHQVLHGDFVSVDLQDPMPLRPGCQCRSQLPRPVRLFGAEFHRNAATLGTCDAEIDVREAPVLAVAFVIDAEIAAPQSNLGKVASVQAARVETLYPSKQRSKILNAGGARSPRRGRIGVCHRSERPRGRRTCDERRGDSGCGNEWPLHAPGEHGEFAVPLNAHRHLRADQAQAFRTDAAGEQAARRYTHFCFRCARDDITVRIADDYVANAQ